MELFDQTFSPSERLPRRLHAEFRTGMGPFGPVVHLVVNGTTIGDPTATRRPLR